MANVNGYDGYVTMPTTAHNAAIKVWQADFSRVISDVTSFGDTGRKRVTGLFDVTGSLSGTPTFDVSDSQPGITTANWSRTGSTIVLGVTTATTACCYTVTAVMSNISFNVDKGGDSTISFNFQNSGGTLPTETWDETP